jgi:uncharacterized caspase-like protein
LLAISLVLSQTALAGIALPGPYNPFEQFRIPPRNVFVLSIGIEHYKDPKIVVNAGAEDARNVADIFEHYFRVFAPTTVLLNADATKANIREALQRFALTSHSNDMFVLSFSGFGLLKSKGGGQESYLAPYDASLPQNCNEAECVDESSLISSALLNSWMTQVHAQRQIILLDTDNSDKFLPVFEDRWRKESCAVGPAASKRLLIVTNHGGSLISVPTPGNPQPTGYLSNAFVKQLQTLPLRTAFRLQQGLYALADPQIPADPSMKDLKSAIAGNVSFRAELLGGDFLIGDKDNAVAWSDLVRDSGLGALCYSDPTNLSRGLTPEEDKSTATAAAAAATDQSNKPTNYALVIASDDYKNWPALSNPIFDATTIENDLTKIYGFKVDHLWNPTRDQLRHKLDDLHAQHFNDQDQLFIFIAGHGDYDEANDIGYLVFPDTPSGHVYDDDLNLLELRQRIDTIHAKHIFLVMDSCFAGSLDPNLGAGGRGVYDPIPLEKLRQRTADKKTRYFLTSGGKEYVPDGTPGSHSPFAALFIQALEKGSNASGYLNLSQLPHYFERLITVPRAGNLRSNEDGADFFFVPVAAGPNGDNGTPQSP